MSKRICNANILSTKQITPHLQRITLGSDEFKGLATCYTGNHVKLLIPCSDEESSLDKKRL
jgi:NADPH-dependent ferric siderophore reductase